jgi:ABC-2 type transport system ATP-binding protein
LREPVIRALKLRKVYDGFVAVDDLDLEVYRGEIFGLLGPNGAGKTTTISMLLGLIPPTSGDAWIAGYSIKKEPIEVRRRVGFLAENLGFYDGMTAWENLMITARLNRVKDAEGRIKELIEKVGISEWLHEEVGKFSRGMKQRLGIADALLKRPAVLILDEPTSGIDPKGADEILRIIEELAREEEITVLMSSHLLHQVERICDRVAIMNRGRLVTQGRLEELLGEKLVIEVDAEGLTDDVVKELNKLGEVERHGRKVRIRASKDVRTDVSKILYEKDVLVLGLYVSRPSLAEIYSELLEADLG